MSNSTVLAAGDPDDRLDTGMKASEATRRARDWWQKTGRHQFVQSGFASPDPDSANHMPSGIVQGLEWDALTKAERLRVVKAWHHFNVRVPDKIGTPEHEYRFGEGKSVQ